jgi:regulation of enolase protein 1 (concanavalin A-like superfamily)
VDARGGAGTVYAGYDALDRPLWRNSANTPGGATVSYTYDGMAGGSMGVGRLASEVFRASPGTGPSTFSGSYTSRYDTRGQTTRSNLTTGGAGACPSGWTCADIGAPAAAGTQSYVGDGAWSVAGAGDLWVQGGDQFHFVSQSQTGDGSISARVTAQANTSNGHDKAGVMLRDGTAQNAAFYYAQVEPNGYVWVTDRPSAGAWAGNLASLSNVKLPVYVKVTRSGSAFSAATSPDGVTWTTIPGSSATLSLSTTLQAGVIVASANANVLSTTLVDQLSPSAPAPSAATSYPVSQTYDDAGSVLTQTYPTGETVTTSYTAQEWFAGLSTSAGTTTLVNSVSYSGLGGRRGCQPEPGQRRLQRHRQL